MLLANLLYVAQIIDNSFSSDCFILIICLQKVIIWTVGELRRSWFMYRVYV